MTAPAAVDIRDLRVRFGETTAVDDVDLEVGAGEVFGLLGPNGAGKTTTIRVLTTLLPATEGSARVFGVDVARHPMDVRRLLGFVPQQPPPTPRSRAERTSPSSRGSSTSPGGRGRRSWPRCSRRWASAIPRIGSSRPTRAG